MSPASQGPVPAPSEEARLIPGYTFEEFVVGPHNRFPHAAAQAVSENLGKAYNPLFLYGPVGMGKTHLMQAVGHRVLQKNAKGRVLYVTAEQFMMEVIELLQEGNLQSMREKYRQLDLLLVDDIQFLATSESTQEEFFHTFNELHHAGKQIIMTSDRPPKMLTTLEDRLRSRFEWGLIADIKQTNLETRVAILRKKETHLNGMKLGDDIRLYIASRLKSNIRELEGFLRRVQAYAQLNNQQISLPLVKEIMRELLPPQDWNEEESAGADAAGSAAASDVVLPPPSAAHPSAPPRPPQPPSSFEIVLDPHETPPAPPRQPPRPPRVEKAPPPPARPAAPPKTPPAPAPAQAKAPPPPPARKPAERKPPEKEMSLTESLLELGSSLGLEQEAQPQEQVSPAFEPPAPVQEEPAAVPEMPAPVEEPPAPAGMPTIQLEPDAVPYVPEVPSEADLPPLPEPIPEPVLAPAEGLQEAFYPPQAESDAGDVAEFPASANPGAIQVAFFYPRGRTQEMGQMKQKFQDIIRKHKLKFEMHPSVEVGYVTDQTLSYGLFLEHCEKRQLTVAIILGPPPDSRLQETIFHQRLQDSFEASGMSLQMNPWDELGKDYRYLNVALDITLIRFNKGKGKK